MSLINQVLNDLEKRGASTDVGEATIRVVPLRQRRSAWWAMLALLCVLALGASAWLKWGGALPALPLAGQPGLASKPPAAAAQGVAAMASQPLAASAAAEAPVLAVSQAAPGVTLAQDKAAVPLVPAAAPLLEQISPHPVLSLGLPQSLMLQGKYFAGAATVTLRTPKGREFKKRRIVQQDENKIVVRVNFSSKAGQWSAEVINPDGKTSGLVAFVVQYAPAAAAMPGAPDAAVKVADKAAENSVEQPASKTVTAEKREAQAETHIAGISKQIVQKSPQQLAEAEFRKAYTLMQQGQVAAAIAGYQAALQLDAGHLPARQALARLLLETQRPDDAAQVLQAGLQHDPKQSVLGLMLARLQVARNQLPQALETLQAGLPYAQQQADYLAYAAALYQRLNRHAEAIEHYRKALQYKADSGVWWMGLAISLRAEQQNDAAKEAFRHALESNTLNADLRAYVQQQLKEL